MTKPPSSRIERAQRIDHDLADRLLRADTLTEYALVQIIARHSASYRRSEVIPPRRPRSAGRPATYPDWALLLMRTLRGAFGSMRWAAAIMQTPHYWHLLCDGARQHLGDGALEGVPTKHGPNRHHYYAAKKRLEHYVCAEAAAYRDFALQQAIAQGLLDPHASHSHTAPNRGNVVSGDGTVTKSPVNAPRKKRLTASARTRRKDPGAAWHKEAGENGSQRCYGAKFVHLSVRGSSDRYDRVLLDLAHDPGTKGYGGEVGLTMDMLSRLLQATEGVHGLRYDGAMRGVHRDALMKLGLMVITPNHGGSKPRMFEHATACGCPDGHELWHFEGGVSIQEVDDRGDITYPPLPITKIESRRSAHSTRWYHVVALPCGIEHRVRIDSAPEDESRGFHRAEHLLQAPPHTDLYKATYGWREDTESINSRLDDTLHRGRMIAYGTTAQYGVVIDFCIAQNAIAGAFHAARHRKDAQAPAA